MSRHRRVNGSSIHFSPLNDEQKEAMRAVSSNAITFLTGPSGTAKTTVATAFAVQQMLYYDKAVSLARPAIQSGSNTGYLPGTAEEKVAPFLRPAFRAIEKLFGEDATNAAGVKSKIRIMPLCLIRGMTIEDEILLVDEAQNLTWDEILTVCTRIGHGGNIIFAGDIDQHDLNGRSMLEEAARRLDGASAAKYSIGWYRFSEAAIVRHPLVGEIIRRMKDDTQDAPTRYRVCCRHRQAQLHRAVEAKTLQGDNEG